MSLYVFQRLRVHKCLKANLTNVYWRIVLTHYLNQTNTWEYLRSHFWQKVFKSMNMKSAPNSLPVFQYSFQVFLIADNERVYISLPRTSQSRHFILSNSSQHQRQGCHMNIDRAKMKHFWERSVVMTKLILNTKLSVFIMHWQTNTYKQNQYNKWLYETSSICDQIQFIICFKYLKLETYQFMVIWNTANTMKLFMNNIKI